MPTKSRTTKPGTRKLSELAKHLAVPKGITSTGWPAVRKTCVDKLGIEFDDWQDAAGRVMLAKRDDGNLAAMVDGVGLSLPRQVGKTYLVGSMVFALCVNQPGLLVIWSAHHARTHGETFLAMQGFAERSRIQAHVRQVFTGSGTEEIRFHNGSRILFGARERGFGRGIPGVDVLIFDEAQILSDKALANMLATMNTSRFGLQLYIGTPPKPDDMSESFSRMRREALAGTLEDGTWIEFGAAVDAQHDDRAEWQKANPSYPKRTPPQSLLRLKRKLTNEDWLREGMGIWDEERPTNQSVVDLDIWDNLKDAEAPPPAKAVVVVDVDPNRARSSIGLAAEHGEKTLLLGEFSSGTSWVVPSLVKLRDKGTIDNLVSLHPSSQAGALIPAIEAAGFEVYRIKTQEMGSACAAFIEGVPQGRFVHVGQPELDAAVAIAKTRYVSEAELWDRKDRRTDISPLVAVSAAAYLLASQSQRPSVYDTRGLVTF